MSRIHLFEFEDLKWFPKFIRDFGTDYLQFVTNKFDFYRELAPKIINSVKKDGHHQIIDVASGGGGAWKSLYPHIKKEIPDIKILLTDYYPNLHAFSKLKESDNEVFDYIDKPVDALNVPENLKGLRTQFLSFHHFKPNDAKQILQNTIDSKTPIAIFEGQERSLKFFIERLFSPLFVLLVTPAIKPFKVSRIIFTYLIPIVPLFVWWDGLVSVLRTYSIPEMEAMVKSLYDSNTYNWEIDRSVNRKITVLYLIGNPK